MGGVGSGINRATQNLGGLVGILDSSIIKNSLFDGHIQGHYSRVNAGGLVGSANNSKILNSRVGQRLFYDIQGKPSKHEWTIGAYADVAERSDILSMPPKAVSGGLIGSAKNTQINHSYMTGNVDSLSSSMAHGVFGDGGVSNFESIAGGLIGEGEGVTIKNSYAVSGVSANATGSKGVSDSLSSKLNVGGLIGSVTGINTIINSYSASTFATKSKIQGEYANKTGGIVGDGVADLTNVYYDKELAKDTTNNLGIAKNTTEMKDQATFQNWDFDKVWHIQVNADGYPHLLSRPITESEKIKLIAKVRDRINRYNGKNWQAASVIDFSGFTDGDDAKNLSGVINWGGTAVDSINVGDYTIIASGLYSDKYEIEFQNGKLTILPRIVNLEVKKTYDGNNEFNQGFIVTNKIGSDDVAITGSATVASKDAGTYNKFTTANLKSSNLNYEFNLKDSQVNAVIDKAKISAATKTGVQGNRIYDGTTNAYAKDVVRVIGKQGNDEVFVASGVGQLNHKNAGARHLVDVGSLTLGGKDAKNYELTTKDSVWIINPANLEIIATPDTKIYDGTTISNVKPRIVGLQTGDTVTATQEFDSPDVTKNGHSATLIIKEYKIDDGNNGLNYIVNRGIKYQLENSALGAILEKQTSTNPTTQLTQPNQSTQPTPVQPNNPNQQAQNETQASVDKEKPKYPSTNTSRDEFIDETEITFDSAPHQISSEAILAEWRKNLKPDEYRKKYLGIQILSIDTKLPISYLIQELYNTEKIYDTSELDGYIKSIPDDVKIEGGLNFSVKDYIKNVGTYNLMMTRASNPNRQAFLAVLEKSLNKNLTKNQNATLRKMLSSRDESSEIFFTSKSNEKIGFNAVADSAKIIKDAVVTGWSYTPFIPGYNKLKKVEGIIQDANSMTIVPYAMTYSAEVIDLIGNNMTDVYDIGAKVVKGESMSYGDVAKISEATLKTLTLLNKLQGKVGRALNSATNTTLGVNEFENIIKYQKTKAIVQSLPDGVLTKEDKDFIISTMDINTYTSFIAGTTKMSEALLTSDSKVSQILNATEKTVKYVSENNFRSIGRRMEDYNNSAKMDKHNLAWFLIDTNGIINMGINMLHNNAIYGK